MSELNHSHFGPTPPHYFNCPMAVSVDEITINQNGDVNLREFKTAAMQGIIAHQMAELELLYGSLCTHYFNKAPSSSKRFGRRVK